MRIVPLLAISAILAGCLGAPGIPAPPAGNGTAYDAIKFETSLGTFTAVLYCKETPKTCAFMKDLVDSKYYDGRAFGRVIPGFVIQEVDRTGGTTDQPKRVEGEFGTAAMFSAGAIGIARDADPNSGGSEFFVMDFATSRLYGNYTAFAQVVDGLDIVHAVARVPAIKTGPASQVGAPLSLPFSVGVHDRVPIDPPQITHATWTSLTLPPETAAQLPLQVGESYGTDTLRATLEWPADLRPGHASAIAWYVSGRDTSTKGQLEDPAPVDLHGATVRYDGAANGSIAFTNDPKADGALSMTWTPPAAGRYQFHLTNQSGEIAIANVTV